MAVVGAAVLRAEMEAAAALRAVVEAAPILRVVAEVAATLLVVAVATVLSVEEAFLRHGTQCQGTETRQAAAEDADV